MQVFSAAGRFCSRDLNLEGTEGIVGHFKLQVEKQELKNKHKPGRRCKQQNFVCIKRFPLHQERDVRHLLVVQEVRV